MTIERGEILNLRTYGSPWTVEGHAFTPEKLWHPRPRWNAVFRDDATCWRL